MSGVGDLGDPRVRTSRRRRAVLFAASALYLGVLGMVSASSAAGPEHESWGALNLYLPQWFWGLPLVALLPATLVLGRRWVFVPVLELFWVLGPIMGFCWPAFSSAPAAAAAHLRVMTYNVKWGRRDAGAIMGEITEAHPDLLLVQDSDEDLSRSLGLILDGWQVRSQGQFFVAYKRGFLPEDEGTRPPSLIWLRCRIALGTALVNVVDAHLLTPREGLTAIRFGGEAGIPEMHRNIAVRLREASLLAGEIRTLEGPTIVAGDFNAPEQSLTCRALLHTGLRDAFSSAGWGYGYTYGHDLAFRHSYMRIDHILTSDQWRPTACWTGGADGSDHRPVVADLDLLRQ